MSSSRFIGCNSTCLGEFCTSQSSGIASLASIFNSSLSVNGTSFDHMLIACDGGPGGYCSSQGGAVFAVVSEQGQNENVIIQIQASSVIGSFCTALVSSRSDPLSVASGGFLYSQGCSSGECNSLRLLEWHLLQSHYFSGSLYNLTVRNCSAFQGDRTTLQPESSPKVAPALILGGGIYCISSALSVGNSVFLFNVAVNGSGGGLAIGPGCSVSCIGCTFSNNSAHLGAGLHLQSQGSLSMSNSTVSFNTATDFSSCSDYGSPSSLCYGKGAGIHASISFGFASSSVFISNSIVSFNAAHKFSLGSSLHIQVNLMDAVVDFSNACVLIFVCRVFPQ